MKPPSDAEMTAGHERLTKALVDWGAKKVILFGSVARGDYTGASDIDLIVVKESDARLPARISEAIGQCEAARPPLPFEPVVYTPAEYARLVADENPLVREAHQHGRVLHDEARACGSLELMRSSHLSPAVEEALRAAKARLAATFGSRLHDIRLYGSVARGEAGPDSDVDVAVILDEVRSLAERADVMELVAEIALERDLPIEALVLGEDELGHLRRRETALARAIDQEGLSV